MHAYEQLLAIAEGRAPGPPIADTIGMTFVVVGDRDVVVELTPEERHYNILGSVQGGVLSTLLDAAVGCAVWATLESGESFTSLDLNVKFLRPVTVESGRLRAEGSVIQRGRRTALAQAQVFDESGKLVAHATSTCMFLS